MRAAALFLLVPMLVSAQESQVRNPLSGAALIDQHISARWQAEGVKPAAPADDAEWLRRVHLDIAGVIPPADVVLRYVNDRRADKRVRIVDELLSGDLYAQNWADLWEAMLVGYDPRNPTSEHTLSIWLRDEVFSKNLAYDEMARRLINARGSNKVNGASIYWTSPFRRAEQITEISSRTSRIFLGVQIHCAQCHDHPFDRYTQEDYVSTLAFFVRVGQKKSKPDDQRDQEYEIFERKNGEAQFPLDPAVRNRKAMPPKSIDGQAPEKDEERRAAFVRILTRPDNLQFARAIVNRYWGHFFGRGLVHPIDDFNLKNKASHPELINELAQDFIRHKYDLKWLIRALVASKPYLLSSRRPAKGAGEEKLFGYALVRAMTPEQLFNSITEAVGVADRYQAAERRGGEERDRVIGEKRNYIRQFRFTFGDDEQADTLEFQGTIPQALTMINGDLINRRMVEQNGRLDLILRTRSAAADRAALIFLSVLSRHPNPKEAARLGAYIGQKGNKRETYEDIMWTLLNSSEFFFVH